MDRHWVGIQCEAGEASKAKPTVAEASEDHAHARFNHFNHALLVAVQCEVSGASEATPAVAEASEASGSYLYNIYFLLIPQLRLALQIYNLLLADLLQKYNYCSDNQRSNYQHTAPCHIL